MESDAIYAAAMTEQIQAASHATDKDSLSPGTGNAGCRRQLKPPATACHNLTASGRPAVPLSGRWKTLQGCKPP